jgi:purine nucleoside permease
MPPPGKSVEWSMTAEYPEEGIPALEAAYQVGNRVVQALITGWPRYRDTIPGT